MPAKPIPVWQTEAAQVGMGGDAESTEMANLGDSAAVPRAKRAADGLTPEAIMANWRLMSIIVGLNHGCVTTPLVFASTLLSPNVAYVGSALLYIFTCLSALFLSVLVVLAVGQRRGLFVAMALYCVYVGAFAAAAATEVNSWAQWLIFLPGSCLGGTAASILWTAQGGYLDRSVSAYMEAAHLDDRQSVTAIHTGIFGFYYLIFEVVCKLASSLALWLSTPAWLIFSVSLAVAAVTAGAYKGLRELGDASAGVPSSAPTPTFADKLLKAVALWRDPSLWLLSLTNLTFGFSAAFMNGYVNAVYTKPQLGPHMVGYFATATALVAAMLSHMFGAAAKHLGTKGPFIFVGSLCFMAIPALVLCVGFDGWHYFLIVPYVLQGSGRAVYESTNKGVFADFFPGEQSAGAFANSMMQACLSFAFCFFFSALLPRSALVSIIFVLATCTFPAYLLARSMRNHRDAHSNESDSSSDS